ncbi:hypothetical protein C4552_02535 [Candidatus Parcubacteria bacterium]|nr:MAG: hypothetical protein C4552_02535 [Candidatus Parcubacteria bacterium]
MQKLTLPVHPREVIATALKSLPSARVREVLERRFGLRGKEPETLESIGRSFKVTRERVRQIEAEGLRQLAKSEAVAAFAPTFAALENHFAHHGHVCEESKLLHSVIEPKFHNHVYFLLTVGQPFSAKREEDTWHDRWYTKEESLKAAQSIMARAAEELAEKKKPIPAADMFQILKTHARDVLGSVPNPDTLESYLSISKLIKQNPYGEFGLVSWPTIRPRGVKDKAYAVLARAQKPMHFREVAGAISKSGWSNHRAHPQTVHNELIKDSRFVLVGRGLYALSEWGYQPGTVSDIIAEILRNAKRPLPKEEIAKRVLAQRFVKPNTVFLNLQNKDLFRRSTEGYQLV